MGKAGSVRDAIILGGGPAGCAAAIACAQRGLDVVLVESQEFPRDRPGETLHPGVEPLLRQLGAFDRIATAGFLRHTGNSIEWGAPSRFEPFGSDEHGPWQGFQAWRATLDVLLLDRARECGVQVCQPCRAMDVLVEEGRVIGIKTTRGEIRGRYVIDAAGGSHWLARKRGLAVVPFSPKLFVRYGYAVGHCPARDEIPRIAADHCGWTWVARVQPQRYQWTRLSLAIENLSKDWLPDELQGLQPQGPMRAADVTWRKVTPVSGAGFFLVGDAAASLDPAASRGVIKGIMSGMMAAHLVQRVLHDGEDESRAASAYGQWLSDWFDADVAALRALYAELVEHDATSFANLLMEHRT